MKLYTGKESYSVIRGKITSLLFLSTGFLAYAYSAGRPEWTEEVYSRGLYPKVISVWSGITSLFGFSLAEFLVYAAVLLVLSRIVRGVAWFIHERTASGRVYYLIDLILSGAVFATAICFVVILLWGLNYNRLPFAETSGLDTSPVPVNVLEQSCMLLAEQTNEQRGHVREDADGAMALSVPQKNTFARANEGYRVAAGEFETLGDFEPGRPKPVLASKFMSYAGLVGIYFPVTAEPNINTDVTDAEIPYAICHELAHQLGYAREDEANFIAWVTCSYSPYEDYRYSGSLMALLHMLNTLQSRDAAAWGRVRAMCSPDVNRDLNAMGQYWQQFEGPVSEISETINDTYLRANRQSDGVQSYGRMVDLVIAYLRADGQV
ncbi:MAG: DUF3810 domain-containing protein [Oscillospiraceae bacterium]|nr:DUF3810 domain-containing protein [Oscillospiraceae bacterium]